MKHIIVFSLLVSGLLVSGCATSQDFDARVNKIVEPHTFSIADWEFTTILQEIEQWLSSHEEVSEGGTKIVTEYFDSSEREPAIASAVEEIIKKQIRDTLNQQGIFNPLTEGEFNFPPVNFRLEGLPHLLVISPRDRIESTREISLKQTLNVLQKETIETGVDELRVSSLVVNIGGIATYPALVDKGASLRFTIDTITEEWLHHYLSFTPLGFRYLLDVSGLSRDYEIATMNESLAGMVSKEIGDLVYHEYYAGYEKEIEPGSESEFDFNIEMREVRKTVDVYLARGEIEQAEELMEQKRQYLVSNGHFIRKLNQAYFAFYGTYAHTPAFISPIGLELKELRTRSDSLKEFLNTVSAMTNRQELSDSVR
ncbi:hypothetical protein ACFLWR_06330 [Chloroflexota bacterium]